MHHGHKKHKTTKTEEQTKEPCDRIRETGFALHVYLRHGHLKRSARMDSPIGSAKKEMATRSKKGT